MPEKYPAQINIRFQESEVLEQIREGIEELQRIAADWRNELTEEERSLVSHASFFAYILKGLEEGRIAKLQDLSSDGKKLLLIDKLAEMLDKLATMRVSGL
jgi:ABC-type ATPase with predicted acetyltransferase domain